MNPREQSGPSGGTPPPETQVPVRGASPILRSAGSPEPVSNQPASAQCWNEIGTHGARTCEDLSRFIHCCNCPVYRAAGLQLLHREVPEAFRREWASRYEKPASRPTASRDSVLLFRVASEWLGLPTQYLVEVSERRRVHSLPHRRRGIVLGLVNIRGELIICISAGQLLGLETPQESAVLRAEHHRLLVTTWHGTRLAFPVAHVHGTERFSLEMLKPPPASVARSGQTFTQGILQWNDQTVGLLDADLFFSAANQKLE